MGGSVIKKLSFKTVFLGGFTGFLPPKRGINRV
jgi:hypothetical protein